MKNYLKYVENKSWTHLLECYTSSSLQINNELFHLVCEENKGRKRRGYMFLKCKQPCSGFELGSLTPFPVKINYYVTLPPQEKKKNKTIAHLTLLSRNWCVWQDVTQSQFLNPIQPVLIQSFSSPSLVALPRLKNPIYLTIYS